MTHFPKLIAGVCIAAFCSVTPGIAGTVLKTDLSKSSITATFRQMGVPVDGSFKKFNARIELDTAKPDASSANVEIDIASFDLGDPEFNKEVLKKEWFNAAQYPRASFTSTSMKSTGANQFEVTGKLAIKGKTADVRFPMTLKKEGGQQVFEGRLPIKRLTFNIGEGEWQDTSMLEDAVVIKFHVVTAQ